MSATRLNRRRLLQTGSMASAALLTVPMPFLRTAKAATAAPLNLISASSTLVKCMYALFDMKGYFEEFGVKPTILNVADNSQAIPALISGREDIGIQTGITTLFPAVARGAKIKILGGCDELYQAAMYSKNPAVKSVKDLEGKIVGTGAIGASVYIVTVATLRKFGVDPSKVTFRNVGGEAAIFEAVAQGTVDAAACPIDVLDRLDQYGLHLVEGGEFWKEFPDYIHEGSYATDETIATKRDALVGTLAAFGKLYRYVQSSESHDDFLKAYATVTGTTKTQSLAISQWNFIQKYRPYGVNIALSEKSLNFVQQLNVEQGLQKSVLPFSQIADMSLAHDALKLLGGPV